jgi:hypothetical protein
MTRRTPLTGGMSVKSGISAGAIVCFDNSSGVLIPVWTPCSTQTPTPTPVPPTPGVQWLRCDACSGTSLGNGQLQNASCNLCYT